ncbi:hypothetical protein KNSL1_010686 [Colletotrichum chrysophilum]|nr:hypothetical protein KNSL1_010686 [Colletotrichum chrysophilum]
MNVPHSDQGKGPVPDQSEVVAALQRQVTDLTNRLEKMEQLISKTKIEEIMKNNEATKPKDADDSAKAAKAEDTAAATKKNKEELGSLAECKVLHVKPGISWKHKLAEIATGKLKKYAMIVCYEGIKTADRLDNEPSPSALPINIIINSVRLDQLLQGFSQNLLPEASHVPYIAPSPFKAFVHLYDKFKSGLKDMEYTFDGQLEVTTDGVNKSSPDGPSGSSNVLESLIKKGETFRSLRYGHGVYKGLNVQPQAPQFVDEEVFVDFSSGYEANVFGIEPYLEPIPLSLPFIEQEDEYGARCDKQNCWTCDINMSVSKLEMKRASDFRATGKYSLTVSAEDFANFSEDQLVMLPRILLGWNCVLLLDEADVYLAERNIHDLDRNGIVSVFLRHLEYYPGILFLTSNREGLIDEAFKSRIHVALRYKSIDAPGTKKIWENILDRIELDNEKKAVKVCFDRNELLEWAESHFDDIKDKKSDGLSAATWNGRQIRNAFQTAIAVASYERIKYLEEKNVSEEEALTKKAKKYRTIQLRSKHFGTVSKVVGEFEDYRKFWIAKARKPQ